MFPTPPPAGYVMDPTGQALFTAILAVPCAATILFALWHLVRRRQPLYLVFLVAGGLSVFAEPVVDVLGNCLFPIQGQWTAFETMGRPIPWLVVFAYPWFIGGQGYAAYRILQARVRPSTLWKYWAATMIVDAIVIQTPGLSMGIHLYYGRQPLDVLGLPLWWLPVDSAAPLVMGLIFYRLLPHLPGRRVLALIPLTSFCYGFTHAALSWPVWSTLQSTAPMLLINLAALATFAMAALAVWAVTAAAGLTTPAVPTSAPPVPAS